MKGPLSGVRVLDFGLLTAGVKIGPNGTPLACADFWISARVLSANHGVMMS